MLARAATIPPLPAAILDGLVSSNWGNRAPKPRFIETKDAATNNAITGINTYICGSVLMNKFERIRRLSRITTAIMTFVQYLIFITLLKGRDEEQINHMPARSRLMVGNMNLTPRVASTKVTNVKLRNDTIVRHRGKVKYKGVLFKEIIYTTNNIMKTDNCTH